MNKQKIKKNKGNKQQCLMIKLRDKMKSKRNNYQKNKEKMKKFKLQSDSKKIVKSGRNICSTAVAILFQLYFLFKFILEEECMNSK